MEKVILELFSGTRSVSNVFEQHGWRSISIDNNPRLNPSICCDILNFQPGMLPVKPDFIWCSIPCTTFSRAASHSHFQKSILKYRQYDYVPVTDAALLSVLLLRKSIEIIKSYPGVLFLIENPVGRLHHFSEMKQLGHFRYFVNYHDFGFSYSKETYLFCNFFLPFSVKKHKVNAVGLRSVRNVVQRSKVPAGLARSVLNYLP